ncbi:MAG: hypothetical protein ACPG49_06540 [Chitinophagales bacterium]
MENTTIKTNNSTNVEKQTNTKNTPIDADQIRPNPHQVTDKEIIQQGLHTMIHFATYRGISIPSTITLDGAEADDSTLLANYNTMLNAIKPANVQSIQYIKHQILDNDGEDQKWYKTPIISKLLVISVIALILLIMISLSPDVDAKNQAEGLLAASGITLLYNLLFICSASLLGVMFYLLKTISDKIKNCTLLPVDAIEVNATILIGLISGFIISELFTFNSGAMGGSIETQKMTLALLGGFSSDAIFSILKGIVNKTKILFSSHEGGTT